MSFWDRVRAWFDAGPERAPDVSRFDDAKLARLWKERGQLTEVARAAVRDECLKRGLKLRGLAREAPAGAPAKPELPAPEGNLVAVQPGPFVFLQTTPERFALVLLPRWSPEPIERPGGFAIDALVVCNHERRGWLDASRIAAAAGLAPEHVYATASGPIDRAPSASGGKALPFPRELTLGNLTLRRMRGLDDVLVATWRGSPKRVAIGPTLPDALVHAKASPSVYVGSLPEPDGHPAWSALLTAAHASAMMSALPGEQPWAGPSVILAGDAIGTPLRRHAPVRHGFGITLVGRECPVAPDAVALLGDVLVQRWESAETATAGALEDVMEHLVIRGETDDARRLVERVAARRDDPTLHRLDATLRALAGDHEGALAALARAERDPFSLVVATSVHCARLDFAAAEDAARRAVASMPRDPDAIAALVRALWLGGRTDDARAVIDDAPAFSLTGTQASDLYELIGQPPPTQPRRETCFPHLAARALTTARHSADREDAVRGYRRALELDPWCAAARETLTAIEAEHAA